MSKRILIVDDEPEIVELLEMRLRKVGYEILTAADGMEGLEKARKEIPDLIILDVMMPKMDGLQVCRFLKFDEKYKKIPIMMLTSRGQDSDKRLGQQVSADSYLPKPYEVDVLLKEVKRLLNDLST